MADCYQFVASVTTLITSLFPPTDSKSGKKSPKTLLGLNTTPPKPELEDLFRTRYISLLKFVVSSMFTSASR